MSTKTGGLEFEAGYSSKGRCLEPNFFERYPASTASTTYRIRCRCRNTEVTKYFPVSGTVYLPQKA